MNIIGLNYNRDISFKENHDLGTLMPVHILIEENSTRKEFMELAAIGHKDKNYALTARVYDEDHSENLMREYYRFYVQ